MDRRNNPYSPGAGLRPAALVGRDDQLRDWGVALERIEDARPTRSVVLHGLRGVGKTVLLGEFHQMAQDRSWLTIMVEANTGSPFRDSLARALYPVVRELVRPKAGEKLKKALATFKTFSVRVDASGMWSFGLDVAPAPGRGDSGELETDLGELVKDLGDAAQEQNHGFAILIDEAQDLSRNELKALCATSHQAGQRNWPFLVALAGLPNLPRLLSEAKSYAERLYAYTEITQLRDDAARQALTRPAAGERVTWEDDAVSFVVTETHGYPYFLQEYGQATWDAAEGRTLTYDDARVGAASGQARLDAGFFRTRWERAALSQRAYLEAMAHDGDGPSQSGEVAARLGKTPTGVGPIRDSLIKKGLIYAPEHGQVAYTVPGMAAFIARQPRR